MSTPTHTVEMRSVELDLGEVFALNVGATLFIQDVHGRDIAVKGFQIPPRALHELNSLTSLSVLVASDGMMVELSLTQSAAYERLTSMHVMRKGIEANSN